MKTAIFALPENSAHAFEVARLLGVSTVGIDLHHFPDGEIKVTLLGAAETAILYMPLDRPNTKLLTILLASEVLRRSGAQRVILVAPYLCYMRQDVAFHPLEAVSQKVVGRLLASTVDRVITFDAHLHRTANLAAVFPRIETDNLSAMPVIAAALRRLSVHPSTVIVGPDIESTPLARSLAESLGCSFTVGTKIRRGDRDVSIDFLDPDALRGRPAVLIDDIVSSGGTLITVARRLTQLGVSTLEAVVTHALFSSEVGRQLAGAGFRSIRSTTSVSHPTNAISLASALAEALRREVIKEIEP